MELPSSNIKKVLIFSQKKAFLIFPEMKSCTFQPNSKNEKIHPGKIAYNSGNGNPEKFIVFSKKKAFLIFPEKGTAKKFFIFQETELFELEK